ncbi:MAG: DNA polymerase, partial [Nitrosarchaeum sp.]
MAEPIPITDFRDLKKVYTKRPQNRDSAQSKIRPIYALDTETSNGDIFLIADSEGNFLDKITPESCLGWLFSKRFHGSWNFFYNLSYDAEVILKLLGSKLYEYRFSKKLKFHYYGYDIEYYPAKLLRIKKGHHSVHYYDIAQFYDKKSLAITYQQNIGKLEEQYIEFKNKRQQFTLRFYNHNKKQIRNYCIQDCILTKELAEKWIKLFYDAFSFYPAKWPSSGYLAEKVLINNGIHFPKFDSIPYPIQDIAFRSYFGGRFEMIKRGFVGKAFLYDINSAYPYAITKIPDLTKGKWFKLKSINDKAKMGFFKIQCDVPDDKHVPPFPFRANNNIIFPSGKFETYATLDELKVCDNSNEYKILESYQFIPNSEKYP